MKDRNKLKNKSDLNDLKTDLEKAKISANLRENEKYLRERLGKLQRYPDPSYETGGSSQGRLPDGLYRSCSFQHDAG